MDSFENYKSVYYKIETIALISNYLFLVRGIKKQGNGSLLKSYPSPY